MSTSEQQALAQQQYQAGKVAFERGSYREAIACFESAVNLISSQTRLGGEVQVWLVTAYEAMDMRQEAIALCQTLVRHPHFESAKQARRLLYILKAPRLKTRPEWLTKIPDLATLEEAEDRSWSTQYPSPPRSPRRKKMQEPPPIDPSQVNMRDNQFVWVALGAIVLMLAGVAWFG